MANNTTPTSAINTPRVFNGDDLDKLKKLLNEGVETYREMTDLRDGLNDAVKALAEDFEVKPGVLRKAIRTAYKSDWDQQDADQQQLEIILSATNKI